MPTVQRPDLNALVLSSALLIAPGLLLAQSPVADIDHDIALVQMQLPSLKKDSVDLTGYSAEGGVALIYRDSAGVVRLIRAHLFGEGGQTIRDFYFRGGALALCQEELQKYNVPFTINDSAAKELGTEPFDPKKTKVLHSRYYFRDGRMIRWQKNRGVLVSSRAPEYRETADEVISFGNELLARFK